MKKIESARTESPRGQDHRDLILYVEDDQENWDVAVLRLSDAYRLLRATNSTEACAHMRKHGSRIKAVLMDIELRGSDLNGIELTELFRGKKLDPPVPHYAREFPPVTAPIIFVTAHGARYTDVELMLFGADRVIPKPVNFADLSLAMAALQHGN